MLNFILAFVISAKIMSRVQIEVKNGSIARAGSENTEGAYKR